VDPEDREEGSPETRSQVMTNQQAHATVSGYYYGLHSCQLPETGRGLYGRWSTPEGDDSED
jgi:hypothetical protein